MIVIMEDIYEQILRHNAIKDSYILQERLKTTLKAFTFNYLDIVEIMEIMISTISKEYSTMHLNLKRLKKILPLHV